MKGFKKCILFVWFIGLPFCSFAVERIIPQAGKFDTRFLIIIDSKSFEKTTVEVMAYKKVLEEQGLGAVVMVGDWENPDQLKNDIIKIYKRKPIVEGAVFIGDIPIVRVRNFQHATTAFKMNEESFPIEESSVTSDRFYDDLDLEFEFLSVDENNPRHFYYKIKENSPQVIESDFYSARILPPSDMGIDVYELLRRYLRKVVMAHSEENYADNIKVFNGYGYNSDCLTMWQNQQFALKEQFPEAFLSSRGNAFYNFRQDPFMKFKLIERMQKSGTDLFVFHEHGAYDTQYINGEYPAPNIVGMGKEKVYGPMDAFAISLRNSYRRYSGERRETFKESTIKEYGLLPSFYSPQLLEESRVSDSTFRADLNIALEDLKGLKPQSRIIIFDACYNAQFHMPGYVAGYYIFSEGNSVVAQGNTVNVLQDKWSLELIGMLAEGARIGFWQKEIQTLESHLIGDPTYRLTPGSVNRSRSFEALALNKNLAHNSGNNKVWLRYLNDANPNYQAIALKQLSKNRAQGYDKLLLKQLKESPHYSVRMEALQRVIYSGEEEITEALLFALNDPYELIRRTAARFAGYCGHQSLIEPLVHTTLFSNESKRVQFAAQMSLPMFDFALVKAEIERQAQGTYIQDSIVKEVIDYYERQNQRNISSLALIRDSSAPVERRVSAIRSLRNNNNHTQVDLLLEVLLDSNEDERVRIVLAEALGWFRWSICKEEIVKTLHAVYRDKSISNELREEILQSIYRLRLLS